MGSFAWGAWASEAGGTSGNLGPELGIKPGLADGSRGTLAGTSIYWVIKKLIKDPSRQA